MVIGLVAVCVVIFVVSGFGKASVIDRFGGLSHQVHQSDEYYRFFTSMFLHLNFLHIASNMISLLIVGPAVEVLASLPGDDAQPAPVVCRQGNALASAFHPELTSDRRLHELFVSMAAA